jgi:tRNA(Glu) U13 pseudouridine synthase TruD
MSPDAADQIPYRSLFEQHGTTDFFKHIKPFPSIAIARHHIATRIKSEIHNLVSVPKGVIVNFTLGKASYATTFLLNLFTLVTDEPVPAWVDRDKIDTKATIGTGSVKAASTALGKSMMPLDM